MIRATKLAVCVVIKCENAYIKHFVDYHLNMGFAQIILYDNNEPDGENVMPIIRQYLDAGLVLYHDVRGKRSPQLECYRECYDEYKSAYDWILFIDCDEYFTLNSMSLQNWIGQPTYSDASSILLNWQLYGDCDILVPQPAIPPYERFMRPFPPDFISMNSYGRNQIDGDEIPISFMCKTMMRCRSDISLWPDTPHAFHYTGGNGLWRKTANGEVLENIQIFAIPDYSGAYIRHYITYTLPEYLEKHYERKTDNIYPDVNYTKDNILGKFKSINRWTEEKQQIYEKFFQEKPNKC